MDVTITPGRLRGSITPPPSKSQAHRLILAAALSDGVSRIGNVAFSQDIRATLSCVEALGASWSEESPGCIRITGLMGPFPPFPGSTAGNPAPPSVFSSPLRWQWPAGGCSPAGAA